MLLESVVVAVMTFSTCLSEAGRSALLTVLSRCLAKASSQSTQGMLLDHLTLVAKGFGTLGLHRT